MAQFTLAGTGSKTTSAAQIYNFYPDPRMRRERRDAVHALEVGAPSSAVAVSRGEVDQATE